MPPENPGITISGYDYNQCLAIAVLADVFKWDVVTFGWLTSTNRFVDSKDACIIALRAGQIKTCPDSGWLYPHEFYDNLG
jgi:hypothetical protein